MYTSHQPPDQPIAEKTPAVATTEGGKAATRVNCQFEHGSPSFPTKTATDGSDVVQSGRPIFDDFLQHLWPYIGNNTANVVFQMVKRLWLIRIDQ
ncbi:hypothetical protein TNCV_5039381 [Trichonephila clavipes]|nr:hypothetical protein TNCV_5039381 [Trichonephila clavipes]